MFLLLKWKFLLVTLNKCLIMRKSLYTLLAFVLVLTACKKIDFDNTVTGEALGTFRVVQPANNAAYRLNAATPAERIVISWTAAKPGLHTLPTYKWVAALKGGNLESPLLELPSDNSGSATTLTLTQKQLDDALKAKGIADGATAELIWSVLADNGSTRVLSPDVMALSVTRFKDGTTPFSILGPSSSATPVVINPNATADSLKFNWTRSMPATGAAAVRYAVHFYKDDAAAAPLFSMASNRSGTDTLLTVSYKDFSDSLTKYGFTSMSDAAGLRWNVMATSGTWVQASDFTNQLYIAREVKLYLVGGSTPAGWTPAAAIRFIEDETRGGVFYTYTYLTTTGSGFKFLSENTDWSTATQKIYGDVNDSGTSGTILQSGDSKNILTPEGDGVYRITVDLANNKYYVQKQHGRMGIVGGATTAGWAPGAVFPAQEMGWISTNLFLGITNLASNGEFKMLDNNDWPNGNLTYTRDYEDAGSGRLKESGGGNLKWTGATGPVRVIWDYRDVKNPKYMLSAATEMRVVGNGIQGVAEWAPGSSPQMTYAGNGRWTITLSLIGDKEIKFLAGNDWGAFDYEDAGNGRIRWDGSNNFKTPTAGGTYTITLDEYKGTVTIM